MKIRKFCNTLVLTSGVRLLCLLFISPPADVADAVLSCMQVSRRLLVVLSPAYVQQQSVSLLEGRLCLYLHHTCHAQVITVRYRSLCGSCTEAHQLRRSSTTIAWKGPRSQPMSSRFWKLLRLAMPVRPLAMGKRMIDSTSTHSDLAVLARLRPQRAPALRGTERKRGGDKGRRSIQGRSWRGVNGSCVRSQRELTNQNCRVCVSFNKSQTTLRSEKDSMCKAQLNQPPANGTAGIPIMNSGPIHAPPSDQINQNQKDLEQTVRDKGADDQADNDQPNNNSNRSHDCAAQNSNS
ncbi:uncharacterized protein LOC114773089 [Denticeps clupeoides]|uniref:uncharacterized protein LOC114773089 n=1 Tax=Denticeps clupeoides TaxID=299321 RepID=UPI0010A2D40E|nr:uncharacterized protein LOC114773089 [Denticeps clupeoides]